VNHNDERDYDEESANRRDMESERESERGTQSFTAMSDDAIKAVQAAMLLSQEKFNLELNWADFYHLMLALQCIHDGTVAGVQTTDWAGSFASGIASRLGVEMI
jgi:hypothetical protein